MSRVVELERIVLGPLAGRSASDWQRAPRGKWSPAQIVEHLTLSLELSARGFEAAQGPQVRRPKTPPERVSTWFVFRLGWIPPGIEAPRRATPAHHVEAVDAERHFREGLARWAALEPLLAVGPSPTVFVSEKGEIEKNEKAKKEAYDLGKKGSAST